MLSILKKLLSETFRKKHSPAWQHIKLENRIIFGKLRRCFYGPSLPKNQNGSINLHLGCGSIDNPKFINIDVVPLPHVHYVRGIDSLPMFKDNSVDLIYACHCLEHIPYGRVLYVLEEWYRVLKKDGLLRLSVPDFDLLLDIYLENGKEIDTIIGPLMGGQDCKYNFHYSIFNEAHLSFLLKKVGFKKIIKWQPGTSDLTTFDDWSNKKIFFNNKEFTISLNLEGIK